MSVNPGQSGPGYQPAPGAPSSYGDPGSGQATTPLPPQHQQHQQHHDGGNGGQNVADRAQSVAHTLERVGWSPETKPFFLTSEFWVANIISLCVLIAAAVDDGFGAQEAWRTVAALGIAYVIARGISRAGTRYGDRDKQPISRSFN